MTVLRVCQMKMCVFAYSMKVNATKKKQKQNKTLSLLNIMLLNMVEIECTESEIVNVAGKNIHTKNGPQMCLAPM